MPLSIGFPLALGLIFLQLYLPYSEPKWTVNTEQRTQNTMYRSGYTGWPKINGTVNFSGLCSDQQLSFFTFLDRASFPHYNNPKVIKFGGELFILWVISYGLSFSGFAINLSLIVPRNTRNRANPENDSQ